MLEFPDDYLVGYTCNFAHPSAFPWSYVSSSFVRIRTTECPEAHAYNRTTQNPLFLCFCCFQVVPVLWHLLRYVFLGALHCMTAHIFLISGPVASSSWVPANHCLGVRMISFGSASSQNCSYLQGRSTTQVCILVGVCGIALRTSPYIDWGLWLRTIHCE